MALAERILKFSFSGATEGSFSAAGLRAVANIQAMEGVVGVTAQVKIWGLSMGQMNTYSSSLPQAISDEIPDANLVIEAGDLGGTLAQVINGPIWSSHIDLTDSPESAFIVSVTGINAAATPTGPQSLPGAQDAETLIQSICAGAGFKLNNNGAHATLRNQSTYGSALHQIDTVARAAGFHWTISGDAVSIWPDGGTVDGTVIDIGPSTDPAMVGYPSYWEAGLIVTSLFNSEIQVGRQMNVTGSALAKANGSWQIVSVQHSLATMMAKAPWFTTACLSGVGT